MQFECPHCGHETQLGTNVIIPSVVRCPQCKQRSTLVGDAPTTPRSHQPVGLLGVLSLVAGLVSAIVGVAAIAFCWTPFAVWSVPLALIALLVGTSALLLDWFRDLTRFSTSVLGVATGTVALCIAFVHQGGLDFKRYKPITITKVVTKEVIIGELPRAEEKPRAEAKPKPAPPHPVRKTVAMADEEFEIAASQKGDRARTAAKMLIESRNDDVFSWQRLENEVKFQFGAIRDEFDRWKQDRVDAGDRFK